MSYKSVAAHRGALYLTLLISTCSTCVWLIQSRLLQRVNLCLLVFTQDQSLLLELLSHSKWLLHCLHWGLVAGA